MLFRSRGRRYPRVRPRQATWIPRGFLRRAPTRADSASTRADSGRLGPESAGIGRNRRKSAGIDRYRPKQPKQPIPAEIPKKKKKLRTHRLLNSNPTSAQMHSKRQKHSSHYISLTLLSALVALCLSASLFRLPLCLSASGSSPLLHQ